jgi:hypothetical protein
MNGFPSPLHPGQWVDGGLADGRYRENAAAASLDMSAASGRWGSEKPDQWYAVYALAGDSDVIFTLKAMPVMRVGSVGSQVISLRNNGNTAGIGYGFTTDELADAKILALSGASRGQVRTITANNNDNGAGGTITHGGDALSLAQGDWFMALPETNFRCLGMAFNDASSNLAPFYQDGRGVTYRSPRTLASGAINGYTLVDLGLITPPTATTVEGYAAAASGYDLKLAISYDGSNAALLVHGAAPSGDFQGGRGAAAFACRVLDGNRVYLNNENTANQVVQVTGWRE